MAPSIPVLIPLSAKLMHVPQPLVLYLRKNEEVRRSSLNETVVLFQFKNDEKYFVMQVLQTKNNLKIYRCNQALSCGDFILVDMSSPRPSLRQTYIVDLKQNAPLRLGGGGAGGQFRNAETALDVLYAEGVIDKTSPYEFVTGDSDVILAWLQSQ